MRRIKATLFLPLLHLLPSKVIARWEIFEGYDASSGHNFAVPLAANAIIPTDCITACERVADCHGFVYSQVLATSGCYFRSDSATELAESRRSSSGATLYVMVTSPAVASAADTLLRSVLAGRGDRVVRDERLGGGWRFPLVRAGAAI